jgi:hypothetical protein
MVVSVVGVGFERVLSGGFVSFTGVGVVLVQVRELRPAKIGPGSERLFREGVRQQEPSARSVHLILESIDNNVSTSKSNEINVNALVAYHGLEDRGTYIGHIDFNRFVRCLEPFKRCVPASGAL